MAALGSEDTRHRNGSSTTALLSLLLLPLLLPPEIVSVGLLLLTATSDLPDVISGGKQRALGWSQGCIPVCGQLFLLLLLGGVMGSPAASSWCCSLCELSTNFAHLSEGSPVVFFFSSQMFQLFNFYLQSPCFALVPKSEAAGQCCAKNWSFPLVWLLIKTPRVFPSISTLWTPADKDVLF